MEREGDATPGRRRTWFVVAAVGWALLGVWWISDGHVWLGVAMVVLGLANLAAFMSPRVAAFADAPLFRRKRPTAR
jgi:hypothetical protein